MNYKDHFPADNKSGFVQSWRDNRLVHTQLACQRTKDYAIKQKVDVIDADLVAAADPTDRGRLKGHDVVCELARQGLGLLHYTQTRITNGKRKGKLKLTPTLRMLAPGEFMSGEQRKEVAKVNAQMCCLRANANPDDIGKRTVPARPIVDHPFKK